MSIISESKYLLQKIIRKPFYINNLSHSLPFLLFKTSNKIREYSDPQTCIPMNRYTDHRSLGSTLSYLSLWSETHAQYLKEVKSKRPLNMDKVLLKNPFKSEQLIRESLQLGIKNMVAEDFDEIWKIHKCRCQFKIGQSGYLPINFVWSVLDPNKDVHQIQTLASYNIIVRSLLFKATSTENYRNIKEFVKKVNLVLQQKGKIRSVYIQANQDVYQQLRQILAVDQFYRDNNIQIILQNNQFSTIDKYFIAAKVLGENRRKQIIINQEAHFYLGSQNIKKGEILENAGKKWLISSISHFPSPKIMQQHDKKGFLVDLEGY